MRVVCVVVVLAGCGRVGFDEQRPDSGIGDDASGSALDDGETCMRARPLAIGVRTDQSIEGAQNDHTSSACGGGPELVYSFQQPVRTRRSIKINGDFNGASWYSTECPPVPSACAGFGAAGGGLEISLELDPGTVYVIIDKISGTGTTFSIAVD